MPQTWTVHFSCNCQSRLHTNNQLCACWQIQKVSGLSTTQECNRDIDIYWMWCSYSLTLFLSWWLFVPQMVSPSTIDFGEWCHLIQSCCMVTGLDLRTKSIADLWTSEHALETDCRMMLTMPSLLQMDVQGSADYSDDDGKTYLLGCYEMWCYAFNWPGDCSEVPSNTLDIKRNMVHMDSCPVKNITNAANTSEIYVLNRCPHFIWMWRWAWNSLREDSVASKSYTFFQTLGNCLVCTIVAKLLPQYLKAIKISI